MVAAAAVHARLLDWYAAEQRDLPWRHTRDPYAVLVSEVMLQQTQVDRVIPKWHTWLARFPTLADLASASRADAIRAWQGLGYNLRAVRLHTLATHVMTDFGGELPRTVDGLRQLKGIGSYTAGAVACFAFEQPVAMVDTNVRRVLSRVFAFPAAEVERHAQALVPPDAAYAWNQALMDLGATVCRARRPLCLVCPLLVECAGPEPPELPAAVAGPPSEPFTSSSRYFRGRVIDALRAASAGLPLDVLCARVGATPDLVDRLARDGLVLIDTDGRVRLPD
jgi:A/G-specific adenine glycosylase